MRETTAERIQRECDSNYQDILELFQGLEDLEVGKYLVGRRGNKTRISWNYDPRDVAAVARGECDNLELSERNDDSKRLNEEPLMRECEFPLRPDLKILFSLPDDFTQKEADRLAAFLKTLPFE
ncbi:MAG TPA: hypothetical protein VK446_11385 [Methylocystis sp.]|nr:hypothetical protein [Methylocystis sp.]